MVKKIIKIYSSSCAPCLLFADVFDKASKLEKYNSIKFESINIKDEDTATLIEKYNIRGVPSTLILDENDELIYKLIGYVPLDEFTSVIDNAINKE